MPLTAAHRPDIVRVMRPPDADQRPAARPGPPPAAELRAITYLAPGIPLRFFEVVVGYLERRLGCRIRLSSESRVSGPMHGAEDPFAAGQADIGFVCAPSYLSLRAAAQPSIELVPAGFVFADPRHDGEPVYFADVVVRADHAARTFTDLAGGVWGYNDECSLSGYFAALQKLQQIGCDGDFFARRIRTGSHLASLDAIAAGAIDAAAIDSTVLALVRRRSEDAAARLRVVESFGPFPVQPIVVREASEPKLAPRVAAALLELRGTAEAAELAALIGLRGCVPIDDAAYAAERLALQELGELPR